MDNQGTTTNYNEITEEIGQLNRHKRELMGWLRRAQRRLVPPPPPPRTTLMASSGTISNNNEITEDHVRVLVAYNGKWGWDGKKWLFENSKGSIMVVSKYVTLLQITNSIYEKFKVDQSSYRLKLEVHYRARSPWFPIIEIEDDLDLSVFISESWKAKLPLCVTRVAKVVVVQGAVQEEEEEEEKIIPDIIEEHRRKGDRVDKRLYKGDRVDKRLYKAIKEDNGVKAREIVDTGEITWTTKLDDTGSTALHFVVGKYANIDAAKDILTGDPEVLETIEDTIDGLNPVHIAALFGSTEALTIMLDSNPKCLFIPDDDGDLAIHYALRIPALKKTIPDLFKQMRSYKDEYDTFLRDTYGLELLRLVIETGLIDVAYELINDYLSMATPVYEKDETPLEWIIKNPDLFYSGTHYNLCQRFVYHYVPIKNNNLGSSDTADIENQETPKKDKFAKHTRNCLHDVISWICKLWEITLLYVPHVKHLKDDKVKHNTTIKLLKRICEEADKTHTSSDIKRLYSSPFCLAVENNTAEAVDVLTTYFPRLFMGSYKDGHNICELTVLNRSEKVYNYILNHGPYAKSVFKFVLDDDGNNVLHLAGRLAPIHKLNAASGAALQMQRELQWFEEVKKAVGITHTRALNDNNETPMMVFRNEHKKLRKDGEEWMKKTADSYTITAALIITIVFAAAITVPGGNNSATGKPIYETKPSLIIFAISDAISLFTSTTSLLLFLSILTARYADEDFLYKLPKRLIFGLVMLFVSVASMMITFSTALYIMFGQGKQWILIPIGALACLPIASFVTLQFPLLVELISSTYGHGIFGNENEYRQSSANASKKIRT